MLPRLLFWDERVYNIKIDMEIGGKLYEEDNEIIRCGQRYLFYDGICDWLWKKEYRE